MSIRQKELLSVFALMAVVAVSFFLTTKIDMSFASDLEKLTGPRAYPRIILAVMGLLGLILLVRAWKLPEETPQRSNRGQLAPVGLAILLLGIFTALFEPLGYLLAVPPLVFLTALLNRAGNWRAAAAAAILAPLILLIVFRFGLNTVLPEGLFGIDQVF